MKGGYVTLKKQEYEAACQIVEQYQKENKKNKRKKKKHIEFYKKMTAYLITLGSFVIFFACYMMYTTKDLSALSTLLVGTTADLLGITKWYCDKSKEEKLDKNRKYYEAEMERQEQEEGEKS